MTRPRRLALVAATLAFAGGCRDAPPEPPSQPRTEGPTAAAGNLERRTYERNFAFLAQTGDSLFIVPWLMETMAAPDTVVRETRGWLSRGGTWEAFYEERWGTPPSRSPARVLPHGSLKLMVREGDFVDGLVFEEGPRQLEIDLGSVLSTWVGPRGETFDLVDGAAYLSDQRVDGWVLDMARTWTDETGPPGDWALLVSGDSLQLVLAGDAEPGGETEPTYRAWARRGTDELQWPAVAVERTGTQAFPPARRDVPSSWRISSDDGGLRGSLEVSSADIRAGEGTGPLLPVRALFEVTGRISTDGGSVPVRGLFVHQRR